MLFKKHSVFFSWLLSYILILFVPIFFGVAVYIRAEKTIEFEINNSNRMLLEQCQKTLDGGLQDINWVINQIEMNRRFKQLLVLNPKDSNNYYDDNLLQAMHDFQYYRVLTDYISEYIIYLKNIDKVFTGNALVDQDTYYKSKMGNTSGSLSLENWKKLLQGSYSGEFIPVGGNNTSGEDVNTGIIYSVSLPLNQKNVSNATLIIVLDYKKVQEMIKSIQRDGNIRGLIIDKNSRVLFSTPGSKDLQQSIRYEQLANESDVSYFTVNGERYAVSFIKSNEVSWKYVLATPYGVFWQKVDAIRLLTVICTILCIIMGVSGSYYLSRKNYIPVNELLISLINKGIKTNSNGLNEYKFIKDAISDTMNENQNMSERLKQQNQALRSVFLAKLIKGKIDDHNLINDTLPLYNLKFVSEYFAVVVFYIKDFDALFDRQYSGNTPEEKLTLVRFIITNVFEELVLQENIGYMTEIDEMNVCLVNFRNVESCRIQLLKTVNEALEFIKNKFKIELAIALSDIHKSYFGIPEAYHEALSTVEYQIAVDNDEITSYSDIKGFEGKYNYTIEAESQLINCIKAGDPEKGKNILNEIFNNNFTKNKLSNSLLKCTMFDLANTMLKAMMEISYICGEEFIDGLHIEDRLLKCGKVKELKTQMTDILEKVCSHIKQNKKGKRDQLVENIVGYIENNYSDVNLSVAIISEKFDLTPAYLTKLFKEQMAEGIFDYICRVRIDKAKILLKSQEDLNIKEIAEQVGYFSSNVFIRAFKKHEGVTPGMYKGIE